MDRLTPFNEDESMAGRSLEPWLTDHAALTEALRTGSRAFAKDLGEDGTVFALLRAERLGVAVLDKRGAPLFVNAAWREAFANAGLQPELVDDVIARQERRTVLVDHETGSAGRSTAVLAPADLARDWTLPPEAVALLEDPRAVLVGVVASPLSASQVLADVCRAFGLTDLQTRVAIGLVRTGDVRGAALEAQISYQTARKVAFDAMRRIGAPRITGLIERLVRLSYGVWPEGPGGAAELADVWGLSARQASLALRIAEGLSRAEAASAAGISEATAKKELELIFETLGVHSATALARAVTEARALALITDATQGDTEVENDHYEPLGLLKRPDGSQVAYSDFGPRSGRPVLVVHSSSASRSVSSRFVTLLHARGFRPLTLDRPGFGLTDPHPDRAAHRADPFGAACEDLRLLMKHLKIPRIDLVARGGAQFAVAMAQQSPELLGKVVLVNPDPATATHNRRRGPVGAIQEAYFRHPDLIERLVRLLVSNLSAEQSRRIMMKAVESSPLDMAVMSDPRNMAEYRRAFRMFSTGRIAGYVAEQTAMTRWSSPPLQGAGHWQVILGRHDFLHDPDRTYEVWRAILPEAGFHWVEDAARFVGLSHPDLIADILAAASESS